MKRTITISMLLSAASVAAVMAAGVIPAPTFTDAKEWVYVGDEQGDTLRIKCEEPWHEELYPDYFSWAGMELKETDSTVKMLAPNIYNGASDLYALLGFTIEGEDVTYFDYNWQPGDTTVILSVYNECTGICSRAYGKRVKVLSIDSVEISGEMRCRYNLESQSVGVATDMKGGAHRYDREIFSGMGTISEPYSDAWVEGIGYMKIDRDEYRLYTLAYVTDGGEVIFRNTATGDESQTSAGLKPAFAQPRLVQPAAAVSAAAGGTYEPTFTASKEWTFVGDIGSDTLSIRCEEDTGHPGYVSWNGITLRETEQGIARYVGLGSTCTQALNVIYARGEGEEIPYFSYAWQPGNESYFNYAPYAVEPDEGCISQIAVTGEQIDIVAIESVTVAGEPRRSYKIAMSDLAGMISEEYLVDNLDYYFLLQNGWQYGFHIELLTLTDPYEAEWIEGIGYTRMKHEGRPYTLLCVTDNGEEIYRNPSSELVPKSAQQHIELCRDGDNLAALFPETGEGAEIAVYDAAGRTVLAVPLRAGATTAVLPMGDMPRGAYIVTLTSTGGRPMTAKMVW